MKNILFSVLLFAVALTSIAQTNFKTTLGTLLKNAETDFVNNTGAQNITLSIKGYAFYNSNIKLGIGNASIIKKENEKGATYNLDAEYKDAKELEIAVKEFIKTYFDASKYDVKETKEETFETYTVEVFPKGTVMPILEMYTDFYDDLSFHLIINIYGYSKNFATIPTQNNYRSKLASLLLNAETDFKAIVGKKESESPEMYETTVKIGLGKEDIRKSADGKVIIYELTEFFDKATILDRVIIDYVKKNYPEPEFLLKSDGDDEGNSIIEVYAKNNAFPFMEIGVEFNEKDQTKYFFITIQGKSSRL